MPNPATTTPTTKLTVTHWSPSRLLSSHPPTTPYALLILNQSLNTPALSALLPQASLLVCADGGANRYYEYDQSLTNDAHDLPTETTENAYGTESTQPESIETSQTKRKPQTRLPDAIVGDLDSLNPNVEEFYRSQGVKVVKDPSQDSTDFTKCLRWIRMYWDEEEGMSRSDERGGDEQGSKRRVGDDQHNSSSSNNNNTNVKGEQGVDDGGEGSKGLANENASSDLLLDVIVLGGLSGRVDQAFSQIHHLYLATDSSTSSTSPTSPTPTSGLLHGRIYLLSEASLSFILADGLNTIDLEAGYFAENIGIIPVSGKTKITTRGLEWDVQDWETEFGGQISTSNHIRSEKVEIKVEGMRPLCTIELAARFAAAAAAAATAHPPPSAPR